MAKPKIILSYRRSDARAMAGRIRDKLALRFGEASVFIDIDNIPFGTDFRKHIDAALGQDDIVIAIIGEKWRGEEIDGQARIFQETDPVRVEIETALRRGITIIPVLIDGATMPQPSALPESIRELSFVNAAEVDDGRDFHQHMERVARSIDTVLRRGQSGHFPVVRKSIIWTTAIAASIALAFLAAQFYPKGSVATRHVTETPRAPATVATPSITDSTGIRRMAFVVGNGAYQNAVALRNPVNDAKAISRTLKAIGFDVTERYDIGVVEFRRALRRFGDAAWKADIAVIFYAGHGIEAQGVNYLIPTDAKLSTDRDIEDEAVPLSKVVEATQDYGDRRKRLKLIIIDAGSENPFARLQSARTSGGLVSIQPAESNTLIAYASKHGSVPLDGDGENSPFTEALLRNLAVPNRDVRQMLSRVRDEVLRTTNNRQEPFLYGSLQGDAVYLVPTPGEAAAADDSSSIKGDFELATTVGTIKALEVFLETHKTGFYADLARAKLEEMKKLEQKR